MAKKQSTSNVFLVTGTDAPTIVTEAQKLATQYAGENPDAFALDLVREQDDVSTAETINQVVRSVRTPPFLGGRKTVWLQNFGSFGSEGKKGAKTPEATAFSALCDVIAAGIPEDVILIMSGPDVDERKSLAKTCKEHGVLKVYKKPELRTRGWERQMHDLVASVARDKGVQIPDRVCTYLVEAIGTETGRIDTELEKLICYCGGPDNPITMEAAEAVCTGQGEAVSWALTNAIGDRNLPEALRVINVALEKEKDPEGTARRMLMQAANFFRQMLQMRVFMQQQRLQNAGQVYGAFEGLSPADIQQCVDDGLEVVAYKPFRAKMLAQNALSYSGPELAESVVQFRDSYWKCVSSSAAARVVLEEIIMRMLQPAIAPGRAATGARG